MEMTNDDDDDEVASHLSLSLSLPPSSCVLAVFSTHVVSCRHRYKMAVFKDGVSFVLLLVLFYCCWHQWSALGFPSIILLFQGMKLLPTGRKNVFYLTLYGSLLGAGSFLLHHFSMLVNSILVSFGLSEEMHNPELP
ncbi:hypothetical protein ACSBR2_020456 [Camellia fascicularis]